VNADVYRVLAKNIWLRKYKLITETYGFEKNKLGSGNNTKGRILLEVYRPGKCKKMARLRRNF